MDNSARFPKKLLLGIVILMFLTIYGIFWLNFFGIFKLPFTLPITRQQPYQEQQQKIASIIKTLDSFQTSLNPNQDIQTFKGGVDVLKEMLQEVKDALIKDDLLTARVELEKARKQIVVLDDPLQSKPLSDEEVQKHDPKRKYVKDIPVDPRVKDIYLQVIDLMVETDPSY